MAGEADAHDPTELAGVAEMNTEAAHAWSLDSADEDYPLTGNWPDRRLTPRRITLLAVVASAVVVAAAGFAVYMFRQPDPAPVDAPPNSTPVAAPSPVPPPVVATVTVDRPPPTWNAPEWSAADDQRFVDNLKARGWNIWDPADVTPHAHTVCQSLRHGDTVASINQQMVTVGLLNPHEAVSFTEAAMESYPHCA